MRGRYVLPVKLGGAGFRRTVERAHFPNTPSHVAPQFLATGHTRGLWPSLDSVFGAGSFNAKKAVMGVDDPYASGSRYALELQTEWGDSSGHAVALSLLPASPRP